MTILGKDINGHTIQAIKPGTVQNVSVTSSSAATTNAVADASTLVRVVSTTNCHYTVGPSPIAEVTDTYLAAGVVEFVRVEKGDKLAFIEDSASGTAFVTEGA